MTQRSPWDCCYGIFGVRQRDATLKKNSSENDETVAAMYESNVGHGIYYAIYYAIGSLTRFCNQCLQESALATFSLTG